jgi:hypothetical protein
VITCPHCNSALNLEQLTEDAAARHLFGLLGQSHCGPAMVAYLGLFKPRSQALRWTRAVALAEDLLARWGADMRLSEALVRTVEALREKRLDPAWRPMTNHNYLASVLVTVPETNGLAVRSGGHPGSRKSRDIPLSEMLSDTSWAD